MDTFIRADALSKSNYKLFKELILDSEEYPRVVLVAVRAWWVDPEPDMDLGRRIVLELKYWEVDVIERCAGLGRRIVMELKYWGVDVLDRMC